MTALLLGSMNLLQVTPSSTPAVGGERTPESGPGGQDPWLSAHTDSRRLWVLLEGLDSSETRPFVTFLPRRPAKWHRLVGIRVREYERRKTRSPLCRERETVTPA